MRYAIKIEEKKVSHGEVMVRREVLPGLFANEATANEIASLMQIGKDANAFKSEVVDLWA